LIEISDSDSGSSHLLARGDELLVKLPENPTTGFRWHFTQSGSGRLRLLEDRFEQGATAGAVVAGAAGSRVVRFAAETSGALVLEALERREWEPVAPGNKKKVFSIEVR